MAARSRAGSAGQSGSRAFGRLEQEMRRSELRYRRLFEAAKDGILILNPDTAKIIDANPFMTEMLGYSRKELLGRELFEIGRPGDKAASRAAFRELQTANFIRYDHLPLQASNGQLREIELVGNVYSEEDRQVVQCNIRDITDRRRSEADLREAQALLADRAAQLEKAVGERTEQLTAANDQLQAFVFTIAHDLRAPLRSMEGYASMLRMEEGLLMTDTAKDYAQRICRSAVFTDELLTDLLAFSRLSQEKIELAPVSLEKVVQSTLQRLEREIAEKKVEVQSAGPWPAVLAHGPILGQVVFNLASNALKFVAPGIVPRLRLGHEERGGMVRLWVQDNGVGILPEYQEQIFRMFTRLHGDKFTGTGIGLAIVKTGVERMNGRVGVESSPGQGSRFWLELQKA